MTWADGYGNWHAKVRTTGNARTDSAKARSLIKSELDARSNGDKVHFSITRKYEDNGFVIYGEVLL